MAILKKIWKDGQFYRAIIEVDGKEIEMRQIARFHDVSLFYEDDVIVPSKQSNEDEEYWKTHCKNCGANINDSK